MPHLVNDERLSTLHTLSVLDAAAGAALDPLTTLAAQLLSSPVAFVSLVEVERQRLISSEGLSLRETPIRDAVCAHALAHPEGLVIADLQADPRLAGNPILDESPALRAYAGVPLVAHNGVAIGTLCVMDHAPRQYSAADMQQLRTLARAVMDRIELRAMAGRREPVSGLPNRQQFALDYPGLLARRRGGPLHAVMIDVLDVVRAGEAGQVLGMAPLEALIRRAGVRLRLALQGIADVYHVGVARFAFLLDLPDRAAVEQLLQELQARLVRPVLAAAVPMSPTFSAGICTVDVAQDTPADVIRKLLVGLHSALSGQTAYCWYCQERDQRLKRGYRLAADAERGLRRDEFHLVYQPRFRCGDLQPVAAEVLIRWDHPRLGPVSPAEFIPVFERTALMDTVTQWVVDHALAQLAQWRRQGITLPLSINVSARDIAHRDAASRLLQKLASHGLHRHDLELEITESESLRADSLPGEQLALLSAQGVQIAIDDFGSGYSNFGYLTDLPIHTVKLDKSLIDNIAVDARARLKVEAILAMTRGLGYHTVAEGVESMDQVQQLRALHCDELQGFALARPMRADDLTARLRAPPAHA